MIRHILKDGTVAADITGHLVKRKDCPEAYAAMERMTTNDNSRKTATRKKLMDRYKARAKRAKSDNMKKMLSFWADYHEDMMDDLGELIELRAKAVSG